MGFPVRRPAAFMTALAALVILFSCAQSQSAESTAYYVDYDKGRDQADGRTRETAWKHAPGDPQAAGAPARTRLKPGDRVLFASGVRYRGSIDVRTSGAAGAPIVFESDGEGRPAIIDGSVVAPARPCASADLCGGAPNWRRLTLVDLPSGAPDQVTLFADSTPLREAQEPDPSDALYPDTPEEMIEVDGVQLARGEVSLPRELAPTGQSGGLGGLALWVRPNIVVRRPVLGAQGAVARFSPEDLSFYTDRPSRVAVVGRPDLVDQPTEYATLPGGRAVVADLPAGVRTVSLATGQGGFRLKGVSHVVIRNLAFEGMADAGGLAPAGVSIFAQDVERLVVENNRFRGHVMPRGQGVIVVRRGRDVRIVANRIAYVVQGSGVRVSGPSQRVAVLDNQIEGVGRTGVMLMRVEDATVQGNRITNVRGVHGNGISAYLDNRRVAVVANTVLDSSRPITFHGANSAQPNNLLFANNLLVATPEGLGALISWGKGTRGVTIRNNVLLGGRNALRLSGHDHDVSVFDNIAERYVVTGPPPGSWRVERNFWTKLSYQQKAERLPKGAGKLERATRDLLEGRAAPEICGLIAPPHSPDGPAPADWSRNIGADIRCD